MCSTVDTMCLAHIMPAVNAINFSMGKSKRQATRVRFANETLSAIWFCFTFYFIWRTWRAFYQLRCRFNGYTLDWICVTLIGLRFLRYNFNLGVFSRPDFDEIFKVSAPFLTAIANVIADYLVKAAFSKFYWTSNNEFLIQSLRFFSFRPLKAI